MDKIRYGEKTNEKETCGKGRWEKISHFNYVGSNSVRRGKKRRERKKERKEKREEEKRSEKLHLISRIHRDCTIGFRRRKRKSSSTRREFHVGTRIRGFCQTLRGRDFFPTLVTFGLRAF